MRGLQLTYDYLGSAPHPLADMILGQVLRDGVGKNRDMAFHSLCQRCSVTAFDILLDQWESLSDQQRRALPTEGPALHSAAAKLLQSNNLTQIRRGLQVADQLDLQAVAPLLVRHVERRNEPEIQQVTVKSLMRMAHALGSAARNNLDRVILRRSLVQALLQSVSRVNEHQNLVVIDIFLAASAPQDKELASLLRLPEPIRTMVWQRLYDSQAQGVIEILLSMLNQPRLPNDFASCIAQRCDQAFRNELLMFVEQGLTSAARRNLQTIGVPASCQLIGIEIRSLTQEQRSALAVLHASADPDRVRAITMVLDAFQQTMLTEKSVLVQALLRFEPLHPERVFQAAVVAAQAIKQNRRDDHHVDQSLSNDPSNPRGMPSLTPDAVMLLRMIRFAENPSANIRKAVGTILKHLKMDSMFVNLSRIPAELRLTVGDFIRSVDRDATYKVKDALHHPVGKRRLQAIHASVALRLVDELSSHLAEIAFHDHMELRVQAIKALAVGSNDDTLRPLWDLTQVVNHAVSSAAIEALDLRGVR